MSVQIRLACRHCDTEECDGVAEIPPTWTDVDEVQSYAESLEEILPEDISRSPTDWYTHLGVCPECRKIFG